MAATTYSRCLEDYNHIYIQYNSQYRTVRRQSVSSNTNYTCTQKRQLTAVNFPA